MGNLKTTSSNLTLNSKYFTIIKLNKERTSALIILNGHSFQNLNQLNLHFKVEQAEMFGFRDTSLPNYFFKLYLGSQQN